MSCPQDDSPASGNALVVPGGHPFRSGNIPKFQPVFTHYGLYKKAQKKVVELIWKKLKALESVNNRHIRYIGREADKETILSSSISNVSIEKIKLYGPLLVLNHLSNEIGLSDILGEYGNEVLSLVFALCIDYKSVNQMARWYERTDLNMILRLDKLTEERLLKALDLIESKNLDILQKYIFEKVKQIYNIDMKGIIYDVTNTYIHGKKCLLDKLGKDKNGVKGRTLIQIGLGVTRKDEVPVFHKIFVGNILDSRTLYDLITSFNQYKINSGLMIYDRGITSARNLKGIKRLKWDTICGMASNDRLKKIARKIISIGKLTDIKQRIKLNKTVFYTFPQKYTVEGLRVNY